MKLVLFLTLAFSQAAALAVTGFSLNQGPATVTLPNVAKYNAVTDFRIEGRIAAHGATCSTYAPLMLIGGRVYLRFEPGTPCSLEFYDTTPNDLVVASLGNHAATWFRAQRHATGSSAGFFTIETWDDAGGNYTGHVANYSSTTSTARNWSGTTELGAAGTPGNISQAGMCNTVVPLHSAPPATGLTAPCSNLGQWNFNSSLADSTQGHDFSLASPTYTTITDQAPGVYLPQLGGLTVLRSGAANVLNFCSSYSLSGAAISSYTFTQTSGATAAISGGSSCMPTITPALSTSGAQIDVRMVVSDGTRSRTVDYTMGVVPSDSRGVVTGIPAAIERIIRPQTVYGHSAGMAWFDLRHKEIAEGLAGVLGNFWAADWENADSSGTTLTATTGSNIFVASGAGANWKARFCSGTSNPDTTSNIVVIRYTSSDYGNYGYASYSIPGGGCVDSTHFAISGVFDAQAACGGGCSGLQYSIQGGGASSYSYWDYRQSSGNYYDCVLAAYALYYRTGLTAHRDFARELARRWWTFPPIDRGNAYSGGTAIRYYEGRNWSLSGLAVYALEYDSSVWIGLSRFMGYLSTQGASGFVKTNDGRERGYGIELFAICGQAAVGNTSAGTIGFTASAPLRPQCNTYLAQIAAQLATVQDPTSKAFPWVYSTQGTYLAASGSGLSSTVHLTNGSTAVTCASGTCDFLHNSGGTGGTPIDPSTGLPMVAWFWDGSPPLLSNSQGDPTVYRFTTVSSTQITLATPYSGATRDANWQGGFVAGVGVAMYMEGIEGIALHDAYLALALAGDSTNAALFKQWSQDIGKFQWNYRNIPNTGMYYTRLFVGCEPARNDVPSGMAVACNIGDPANVSYSRIDIGMVIGALASTYTDIQDPTILTAGDSFMQAAYGKPGYAVPSGFSTNADYNRSIDVPTNNPQSTCDPAAGDCGQGVADFNSVGIWKAFGLTAGYARGGSWMAARLGPAASLPVGASALTGSTLRGAAIR